MKNGGRLVGLVNPPVKMVVPPIEMKNQPVKMMI
jgi:hypothetical protein